MECHGCLKPHTKWFEVTSAEAIKVIKKWSSWIITRPYVSIQLREVVEWTVKEEERKRTRNMGLFLK
jgi:hypothetical protein